MSALKARVENLRDDGAISQSGPLSIADARFLFNQGGVACAGAGSFV